jgi:hypothetical protein
MLGGSALGGLSGDSGGGGNSGTMAIKGAPEPKRRRTNGRTRSDTAIRASILSPYKPATRGRVASPGPTHWGAPTPTKSLNYTRKYYTVPSCSADQLNDVAIAGGRSLIAVGSGGKAGGEKRGIRSTSKYRGVTHHCRTGR